MDVDWKVDTVAAEVKLCARWMVMADDNYLNTAWVQAGTTHIRLFVGFGAILCHTSWHTPTNVLCAVEIYGNAHHSSEMCEAD